MIWYTVDIRCDGFLITFMKSRAVNIATQYKFMAE